MEIVTVSPLEERPLGLLSPSRLNTILKCPLSGLYNHDGNSAYFPVGNSHFASLGNVIHDVFKSANRGNINSDESFSQIWYSAEEKQIKGGLKNIVPNYGKIKYSIRKQLVKPRINGLKSYAKGYYGIPEKMIEDKEHGVKGQPDLVAFRYNVPYEIKDYKTGEVFDPVTLEPDREEQNRSFEEIKEGFKNQLHLYAFLVNRKYGSYPQFLTIVTAAGEEIRTGCEQGKVDFLMNMIKSCKDRIQNEIAADLANPSLSNCRFCPFKPGCKWRYSSDSDAFVDIEGVVSNVQFPPYGNFTIHLQNGEHLFHKLPFEGGPEKLKEIIQKKVFVSNVRYEVLEKKLYTTSKYTKIYVKNNY
ncbi:MAG: PD-(D/E)XK nuclease family protein [Mucilaginibacter sp.]|uniref:PD-(D/E)XK nuclease family protein n=1 Tax=Mucilaginibacter sp. TaxID=1882438 RepID=UPI0031A4802A